MKSENNKEFWERFARLYDPFMKKSTSLYDNICSSIRPALTKDMNVLELACGTGQLSFPLAKNVRLFEATDFSPAMIREAKKKPAPSCLHFAVADATALPYADESFDIVIISNALHIMPNPDLALKEIHRVLKKDGLLYAPTFMQGKSLFAKLRMKLLGLGGFHTFHKWTPSQFASYVELYSFEVTDFKTLESPLLPLCFLRARKMT